MSLALCHHDHDDTEVFGHLLSPASKSEGGLFVHFPNDPFKLFSHVAGRGVGGLDGWGGRWQERDKWPEVAPLQTCTYTCCFDKRAFAF